MQNRLPVFIVGKDFISGVNIKAGNINKNLGNQLRPFENKGNSGIIPKCKVNYIEVSCNCGISKDLTKDGCEQVYRYLSDKIRKSGGTESA